MRFERPLERGRLVQRYKRFFADVVLDDGREITAHCPNPGAMLGLAIPGLPAWLSRSDAPGRKLPHTLELVGAQGSLVGVNTLHPNRLVAEALQSGSIPELTGYASTRREVRFGTDSRVDFLLEDETRPPCWLEVKSVTLSRTPALAEWPDCVSSRGVKHLRELAALAGVGQRAVILFLVQRNDCDRLALAADLDPAFAAALHEALDRGVEVLGYACDVSPDGITLRRGIRVQS